MKQQYKEYIKLNKNILLGFAASIVISAIVAQLFSGQAHYLNATITLAVDYVVYFSTFGGLFYFDNRKKYILESGKTDKSHKNYFFSWYRRSCLYNNQMVFTILFFDNRL